MEFLLENLGRKGRGGNDDDIPMAIIFSYKGTQKERIFIFQALFFTGRTVKLQNPNLNINISSICFIEYKPYNNPDINWFTNVETGIKQPYADLWGTLPRTNVASQKEINLPNIDL